MLVGSTEASALSGSWLNHRQQLGTEGACTQKSLKTSDFPSSQHLPTFGIGSSWVPWTFGYLPVGHCATHRIGAHGFQSSPCHAVPMQVGAPSDHTLAVKTSAFFWLQCRNFRCIGHLWKHDLSLAMLLSCPSFTPFSFSPRGSHPGQTYPNQQDRSVVLVESPFLPLCCWISSHEDMSKEPF